MYEETRHTLTLGGMMAFDFGQWRIGGTVSATAQLALNDNIQGYLDRAGLDASR